MKKSIREIIDSYNIKVWPIGEGVLRGFCPLHTNVNTPSFTVYEHTDSYFCFGEGEGGDTAHFISRMENISYAEAKKRVDGEANLVEDVTQFLDSAAVIDEKDYSVQLNFTVSKYCRDLLLDNVVSVDKIFAFLKMIDKDVLSKPVTNDILKSVLVQVRQLRGDVK